MFIERIVDVIIQKSLQNLEKVIEENISILDFSLMKKIDIDEILFSYKKIQQSLVEKPTNSSSKIAPFLDLNYRFGFNGSEKL